MPTRITKNYCAKTQLIRISSASAGNSCPSRRSWTRRPTPKNTRLRLTALPLHLRSRNPNPLIHRQRRRSTKAPQPTILCCGYDSPEPLPPGPPPWLTGNQDPESALSLSQLVQLAQLVLL